MAHDRHPADASNLAQDGSPGLDAGGICLDDLAQERSQRLGATCGLGFVAFAGQGGAEGDRWSTCSRFSIPMSSATIKVGASAIAHDEVEPVQAHRSPHRGMVQRDAVGADEVDEYETARGGKRCRIMVIALRL